MYQDGHDATNSHENPFWLYSLKQYKNQSCANFLLLAQEQYQLDINILLFMGWLASENKYLPNLKFLSSAEHWQQTRVIPIRQIRRRAKPLGNNKFYKQIKALELLAEQYEQKILYGLIQHCIKRSGDMHNNAVLGIEKYLARRNVEVEEDWLQALSKHLQP